MEQFEGAERLILKTMLDLPKKSAGYVEDTQIADASGTTLSDVRNCLITLKDKGFVEVARGNKGLRAYVTEKGKLALGLTSIDEVSIGSDSSQALIRVVPKGLRSFDE